jgi:hypothetical protein
MFRSAIALAHVIPEYRKPAAVVGFWAREVAEISRLPPELADVLAKLQRGLLLDPAEMAVLGASRDGALTPAQLKAAFRSSMANATDAARADVEYWTSRMVAS